MSDLRVIIAISGVIIAVLVAIIFLNKASYKRRRSARAKEHTGAIKWYIDEIAKLKLKLKQRESRRKEWHLIGVTVYGIKVTSNDGVYAVVEFNPKTGELRAPAPEHRFFTISGQDGHGWNQCGGTDIPRTLLASPTWIEYNPDDRTIPDLIMLDEVYHFRYGATQPYLQVALELSGQPPVLQLMRSAEPVAIEAPSKIAA